MDIVYVIEARIGNAWVDIWRGSKFLLALDIKKALNRDMPNLVLRVISIEG